jgi:hypothetical protein
VFVRLVSNAVLIYVVIGTVGMARAADVEMKIVAFPEHISRYSPFYIRVRITNNGNVPVRGCDESQDKCIAIGWEFAKSNGVPTMPGNDKMAPLPAFINDFLPPAESMEKSIRIVPLNPPLIADTTILALSLIVKEGSNVQITEERLKLPLQDTTRAVRNRRGRVRFLVYTYFFLTVLIVELLVFRQRDQA